VTNCGTAGDCQAYLRCRREEKDMKKGVCRLGGAFLCGMAVLGLTGCETAQNRTDPAPGRWKRRKPDGTADL